MTCCVALRDVSGEVFVAADSLGSDDNCSHICKRIDPKIFICKDSKVIIAFSSSYRMGQLLMYNDIFSGVEQITHEDMITKYIPSIKKIFEEDKIDCGNMLVVCDKDIYEIYADYQIAINSYKYAAIGSGYQYALGSLYTSEKSFSVKDRLLLAMKSAEELCGSVGSPFLYVSSKKLKVKVLR